MKIVEPLAPRKGTVVPIAIPNDGKCLAIDPGNHTGWALFLHGGLIACGNTSLSWVIDKPEVLEATMACGARKGAIF